MIDKIIIEDLKVECFIGVYDWEREVPQTVNLCVQIPCDVRAAQSDQLADTVNYKKISKHIIALIEESRYQLLEKLAEEIAQSCLQHFSLPWIRLRVDKPGALRGARTVGLEIYREA